MKSFQPPRRSLQTSPMKSEPDIHFTPARFSSGSVMTPFSPPQSPWSRTALHPSPAPTLLYQCVASLHRHEGNIFSIAVLQGNVFTGTESSRIRVWKQPDFIERGYLKANSGQVRAIVAYGNLVFTAHRDNKVRVWNVRGNSDDFHSKKLVVIPRQKAFDFFSRRKTQRHQDCISCLAYYHTEGLLYTGSWDKTVKTWRVSDQRCIDSFVAHSDTINAIVVNQDDGFVFTCSSDGSVKIWRRVYGENSHTLTMTLKFQLSPVNALALSSTLNACYLYSASSDGFINFWEKEKASGRFNHGGYLQGHRFGVLCLAATERYIFSGSEDTTIRVWRREEGSSFHNCLAVLDGHRGPVRCLTACLEIDKVAMGFLLFTASMDGTYKVWRVTIFPEEHNTSNDDKVQCCSKMTLTEYERCKRDLDAKFMEFEISPVLSPSWVERKLQCSNHTI
ncbi:myosin heavy chain kinase B-like [Thalictrum thalictroides]|uniref:Myosin heavy chain kinase B-like n=1 Tax=Thalictrum thalictroides TaxID=46969 RepID=A0A7J6WDB5_THATH|nr:myosin heavy chain kinase B-like [Thalictrum thalictroides]